MQQRALAGQAAAASRGARGRPSITANQYAHSILDKHILDILDILDKHIFNMIRGE